MCATRVWLPQCIQDAGFAAAECNLVSALYSHDCVSKLLLL